jgi:DNA-binding transcriptional ArsR family regulator
LVYYDVVDKFSALSDPIRRSIIEMLASSGELSATDIYDKFQVSHPAISQHLQVLRKAELVQVEKRAQKRIYRINPQAIHEVEAWAGQMMQLWNQRFDALDAVLEVEKKKLIQDQKGKDV